MFFISSCDFTELKDSAQSDHKQSLLIKISIYFILGGMSILSSKNFFSAVLFDRDGTLIIDKHYLSDPNGVELLPGAGQAVKKLKESGRICFLLSNQSGIGRGYFSCEAAISCNERCNELLKKEGGGLESMLFCPHAPEAQCQCRKPATGMWDELRQRYKLDAKHSIMIGDKADDLIFARRAGLLASALVLSGKGAKTAEKLGLAFDNIQNKHYILYPEEKRDEYPNILLRDCSKLYEAILELEAELFNKN